MKKLQNTILFLTIVFLTVFLFSTTSIFAKGAKYVSFSGTQKKGTGPLSNARVSSDILVVNDNAKIMKIKGTGDYCIWKMGRNRAFLCSRKLNDLKGKILPKGKYTILPSINKYQLYSTTRITVKCSSCEVK